MSHIVIVVSVLLVNWWSIRTVSRYLAQKRQASVAASATEQAGHARALPCATAADRSDNPPKASAPQSSACAFPVHGLPPGQASAGVLEGLLRHVAGVTRAYVSPVTALAYVDYFPAQVTEEQLVGAIRSGGYRVGVAAQRFDWRHGHPG